ACGPLLLGERRAPVVHGVIQKRCSVREIASHRCFLPIEPGRQTNEPTQGWFGSPMDVRSIRMPWPCGLDVASAQALVYPPLNVAPGGPTGAPVLPPSRLSLQPSRRYADASTHRPQGAPPMKLPRDI